MSLSPANHAVYPFTPWRAPCGAAGPGLPRAVTLEENSPACTPESDGGRSTITQWKKSTRARDLGTVRPSLFTSSPLLGTSGSWQTIANDFVPAGAPLHESCGLRFCDSVTWLFASGAQNANSAGITPPSAKLALVIFIGGEPGSWTGLRPPPRPPRPRRRAWSWAG